MLDPAGLPELENDSGQGEQRAEEFAGEFDAWVFGGHRGLGHAEGLFAEDVGPKARAGHDHFKEAGDDGNEEIPHRKFSKRNHDEADRDDEVEDEPEGRIDGRVVEGGLAVDGGVDVVTLEPSKDGEEGGEQEVNGSEFAFGVGRFRSRGLERFHNVCFFLWFVNGCDPR